MKLFKALAACLMIVCMYTSTQAAFEVKDIHCALFDLYFPNDPQLSTTERKKRVEWRNGLWLYIQTKPEILGLLNLLQPTSPALPDDLKESFADIISNGITQVDSVRIRQLQYSLRRHPDNNVRRVAATLRKLYSYLTYASPLTSKISGYTVRAAQDFSVEAPFELPATKLRIKDGSVVHADGAIDYLILGSGPAGSVIAHELARKKKNCRVVLIDSGSFIKPDSIVTESLSELMESQNMRTDTSGGIVIRNGQALGGGTMVNLDLAFSPLLPQIQSHIQAWIDAGLVDKSIIHAQGNDWKKVEDAYGWVTHKVGTRKVEASEVNENNTILLNATPTAKTYCLNARPLENDNKKLKVSALDAFIMPALQGGSEYEGSLQVIPNVKVQKIIFDETATGKKARGVQVQFQQPLNQSYCVQDVNGFGVQAGTNVTLEAHNVIVCAGTLGSAEILLRSEVPNNAIGKGIVMHPSMGIYGRFDKEIDVMSGISASVYAPAVDPADNYFFESMSAEPAFIALINPGAGQQILDIIRDVKFLGGFGIMLVDSVHPENKVFIDPVTQTVQVNYTLSEGDKRRFRKALASGMEMLFDQGAYEVHIPSCEPLLSNKDEYQPLTSKDQIKDAIEKLQFIENENFISSAHMQGSNKMGNDPEISVVSPQFKVWNQSTKQEIPNLYVCDSSIFPTSVGANPMQSIYTFAKLFVDRHIEETMHSELVCLDTLTYELV